MYDGELSNDNWVRIPIMNVMLLKEKYVCVCVYM